MIKLSSTGGLAWPTRPTVYDGCRIQSRSWHFIIRFIFS